MAEKKSKNLPVSEENANEIVEKTQKQLQHRNRPDLVNFGQENVKPGDNAKYIKHALAAWHLPPIDINDEKQVEERITWFFCHCIDDDMKPTVTGLCNALGISRKTLWDWEAGRVRSATHTDLIKRAKDFLAELWEDYMLNGKINPVSGIFLGKNHFGYQDKSEVVITPNNALGAEPDPEEVRKRYLEEYADSDSEN